MATTGTFVVGGDQTGDTGFIVTGTNLSITSTFFNITNNATEISFSYTSSITASEGLNMQLYNSIVIYQFDGIPLTRNGNQFNGYTLSTFGNGIVDYSLGMPELLSNCSLSGCFQNASSFNQEINDWTVDNVTNMSQMFNGAIAFNQPLDNWDVSNVTNMSQMFNGAIAFNQPLDNWDVSNVTNTNVRRCK